MTSTQTTPSDHLVVVAPDELGDLPWSPFVGMRGVDIKELHSSRDCVAGLLRLEPGAHEIRHSHHAGQHHMWVLDGAVHVDGAEVEAGTYVLVPPGLRHTLENRGSAACTVLFFYAKTGDS
jgi:quercetin dioxygenase-like cupin family protein